MIAVEGRYTAILVVTYRNEKQYKSVEILLRKIHEGKEKKRRKISAPMDV